MAELAQCYCFAFIECVKQDFVQKVIFMARKLCIALHSHDELFLAPLCLL